jgi:hypothetical protein
MQLNAAMQATVAHNPDLTNLRIDTPLPGTTIAQLLSS